MDFLLDNFKHLTTTPKNVEQLKKLVLQLAVQGKLTTQWREENPDVEPASVLLERIKAEKEQLINDGKLKREKPLQRISKVEIPFEIPENWIWCRMQEVGLFERGKSKHRPRNDTRLFEGGTIPFVQTGEVAQSKNHSFRIKSCSSFYNDFGLSQSRLWPKGTMCITIAANIAQTGFLDIDACFPDSVVGFTSLSDYSVSEYIRIFIDLTKENIEKFAPATAQKNINLGIIYDLKLPLPSEKEIKAIVSKVESLFAQIDQLHELAKKKVALKVKAAKALFGKVNTASDAADLQETWQLLKTNFSSVTQSKEGVKQLRQTILQLAIQGKLTAKWREENPDVEPASVLLEKIKAEKEQLIKEGKLRRELHLAKVSESEKRFELPKEWTWCRLGEIIRISSGDGLTSSQMNDNGEIPVYGGNGINGYHTEFNIEKRTIIIGRVGANCGSIHLSQEKAWITDNAFITSHSVRLFQDWLYLELVALNLREHARTSAQPVISGQKVYPLVFGFPPYQEQQAIVSKVNQLMALCDELEKKIEKRDSYQERIMQAVVKQAI